MAKETQALVVGASAVGGICAGEMARRGVQVTVLEEHDRPGKFHKCSGIMSKAGLESLGVDLKDCVLNEVSGAVIRAGRAEMRVRSSKTQALVINRQAFDEKSAEQAQEAGARIAYGARASPIARTHSGFVVKAGNRTFEASVLAGCDGAASAVARELGFPAIPASDFVLAWEAEYARAKPADRKSVEIILSPLFKSFFAWIIPVNEERVRAGFATSDFPGARQAKQKFLELDCVRPVISRECTCVREFHHVIPLNSRKATQDGKALLCGDAAGQVKSTTGGGVVFGGKCAQVAAEQTARYLLEGTPLNYESVWRAKYGRILGAHALLRKAYNAAEAIGTIPALAAAAGALGVAAFLETKGDMDFIVQ